MNSIRKSLFIGLALAACLGAAMLFVFVLWQYQYFAMNGPALGDIMPEILDHVLLPLGLFFVLFGAGTFWVVHVVEGRLQQAASQAQSAAHELRSYEPDMDELPAEVRPFANAIRDLTLRLEGHARRQEAFAEDAAHELKTPLAVMMLELDEVPAKYKERLREQLLSLSAMVDQLLLLARSNSPSVQDGKQPVFARDVGRSVAAELAPAAIAVNKSLAFEEEDAGSFCGLHEAVSAALRTLVVNAIRIAPEGTEVVVKAGPGPVLEVRDSGPGILPEEFESLRARGSRADQAPKGEAGLGLAIADRIVDAHGGILRTTMPDHAAIRMEFPVRV